MDWRDECHARRVARMMEREEKAKRDVLRKERMKTVVFESCKIMLLAFVLYAFLLFGMIWATA